MKGFISRIPDVLEAWTLRRCVVHSDLLYAVNLHSVHLYLKPYLDSRKYKCICDRKYNIGETSEMFRMSHFGRLWFWIQTQKQTKNHVPKTKGHKNTCVVGS